MDLWARLANLGSLARESGCSGEWLLATFPAATLDRLMAVQDGVERARHEMAKAAAKTASEGR